MFTKDHRYFLSVVSAVQDAYRPQDQPDLPLEHQRREVAAIIFRVGNPVAGAGRGNRTPTGLSALRILSPLRLPVSPSRLQRDAVPTAIRAGRVVRESHEAWFAIGPAAGCALLLSLAQT